ncbi:MAG TPA: hypothetical protein VNH40_02470, partial [Gaiellaceae bacterium]|nr:hypothetical protein [Gaiellaceae bacterium]
TTSLVVASVIVTAAAAGGGATTSARAAVKVAYNKALMLASGGKAAGTLDLHDEGDLHEGVGQTDTKDLQQGRTYTASRFAIRVRVQSPDALWGGGQIESGSYRFIQVNHLHATGTAPLTGVGYITIESATVSTPSAAEAIKRLHATPHIQAGPITPTRIAGFRGQAFDATITAEDRPGAGGLALVPFTTDRHCGYCAKTLHGETKDVKVGKPGQRFRIIALNVRGKTVIVYLESIYADQKKFPPAKLFPTFLPYAQKMLANLSFP